jgi:hypothetical protein
LLFGIKQMPDPSRCCTSPLSPPCAARIGSWWGRFLYQLFGLLSEFGYSIARPSWALGAAWLVGFLPYHRWLMRTPEAAAETSPIFTAAGFSFSNLFGFLGFSRLYFSTEFLNALPTLLKVIAARQTVAGVILLFFLGLGLRNRFRLK